MKAITTAMIVRRRIFAAIWCVAAIIVHFAFTFLLTIMQFGVGMGAFTEDVSSRIAIGKTLLWIWTPLAMAAWDPKNMHNDEMLITLAFSWSCCFGVFVGFAIPAFLSWLDRPLYPPAER